MNYIELKLDNFWKLDLIGIQENGPSVYEKFNIKINFVNTRREVATYIKYSL